MLDLAHKKLDVWKKSIEFVSDIYEATDRFPKSEIYELTSQLRRAAASIPSNIAEGASRKSPKERRRFYEIARSSLAEIDTQLEITARLSYTRQENLAMISDNMNHLFAMISKLIATTR